MKVQWPRCTFFIIEGVKQTISISLFVLLLFGSSSCFNKKKKFEDKDVVARAGDELLYITDLQNVLQNRTGADSAEALKKYAEAWTRKKMLLRKAEEQIPEDDLGITKKVDDYRESLLLYEYEKAFIAQKLDTAVSLQELNKYYEQYQTNFNLESDVYLVFFVKLKLDAPDLKSVKQWVMKPKDEDDLRKLEGYCKAEALSHSMSEGLWYTEENAVKNFPISEGEVAQLANTKDFKEVKTDDALWFIRVADVKRKDAPAPLKLVADKLRHLLVEKRKVKLIENLYDKVYSDALKTKDAEVFVK